MPTLWGAGVTTKQSGADWEVHPSEGKTGLESNRVPRGNPWTEW